MDSGKARSGESEARLQHLQSIGEAALAHLRFDDLVNELLGRITAMLGADTAAVLLVEEGADALVPRAAKGIEGETEGDVRIPLGQGFAGRVAAERRPIVVPDVEHADIFNPILRARGLRSLLGVPLIVEGRVIGVAHVGTLERREFTADDIELLQLAADRMALAIDHSRMYEAERDAAERLRRLEAITEVALAHLDLEELQAVLLARIRDLLSTDTVALLLVDDERGGLVARATLGTGQLDTTAVVAIGEGLVGRVAAEGRAQVLEDVQGSAGKTPIQQESGLASLLGVPLIVGGTVTGVLGVGSWRRRRFSPDDVDLLQRAADRIALALENARLYAAERAARARAEAAADRIRRIESITEVALHHIALDDEVLERLLTRVREVIDVDTAALLVTDDARQTLVARAAKGFAEEVERGVEVAIGQGFAGLVAERREPVVVRDASEIRVVSPLLRETSVRSLAGVPLIVEDRLLGVLHVGSRTERDFGPDELALLELAGERLAVAIDHSRLYEREHLVAETLQRSLLPEQLPEIEGVEIASSYLPAEGEAVGGDWYDVIMLGNGRVGIAMGDVVSRGVRAASSMGQIRNALRAYALEDPDPASMLGRLDEVVRGMEGREMATLVYAMFEPLSGELAYACAGHPPAVLVDPRGAVTLLEEGRGPPLGAVPDAGYRAGGVRLEPGSTLLLYTDGLVERRDMWVHEGIERLAEATAAAAGRPPELLLDHLATTLLAPGRADDDVAMLALQSTPGLDEGLRLTCPADPGALSALRQALRRWLAEAGAGEDETYDLLVATTEAAANAVEHAYGPLDASFDVTARLSGGEVIVTVRDQGAWRPPRGHNRGRGTLLMQELMDGLEVITGDSGTEVRLRKRLSEARAA